MPIRTHCPNCPEVKLIRNLYYVWETKKEIWKGYCAKCSYLSSSREFNQHQDCFTCKEPISIDSAGELKHSNKDSKCLNIG